MWLLRLPRTPSRDLPSSSGKRPDQVERGRSLPGPVTKKSCPAESRMLLQVSILVGHQRIVTTAFVDSGAAGNIIDQDYAAQLGIETEVLSQPLTITTIDGRPLNFSPVIRRTKEIHLIIGNHTEKIQLYITKITSPPVILGHPWLITHDPFISWTNNKIVHWGRPVGTFSGESEASDINLEEIPVPYRDLAEGAVPPRGLFLRQEEGRGLRPCMDYRGLNQITIKNRHPLPLTNTALDALSGARFFTKLDLRSAYNLVRIREGDEWKTAFITPTGHYETLVMPFGLCNSPSAFQQFINDVLRDMLGRWCYAYLDGILIYSKTLEEHTQHVRAVLRRLLAHQLYCKLEKCAFHQHSTTFLGFVISSQGVVMDPQKLEAVRLWLLPMSLKQLQRFLGFANFYRRFIQGFSATAAPLTALTKPSHGAFHLTPEAIQAFKTLCNLFTTAPVLTHPNPDKPFVVEVDASDVGVGAVLSQRGPETENYTHQRYGVGDRELLAIKWALEEWRHWLQGGGDPFTVWTDHQNLTVIRQTKQLNPRQARWALFFEHFNFQLSYRSGSKNSKADAISRQHQRDSTSSEAAPVLPSHVILAPLRWGLEERVRQSHSQNPLLRIPLLDVSSYPTPCAKKYSRHPGVQRTITFITRAFWWRTLRRDVQQYVQACNICARSKTTNTPSTGELQPLPIPKRPWSHISIDFVTGLPESQGKNTILTIVDRFSKAVHLVALTGLPSAKNTAELILEHVVRLHGFPKDIVSDRGPQFTAKFWQAFCRLIGTTSSLSSGFHPQTNGQTERANQQLECFLRCFAGEHQRSWARYLVWAELSNNIHILCHQPEPIREPEVEVPSAQQLVRRCRRLWNHARITIQKTNTRYTTQHRRRHPPGRLFHVGDRVYLSTRNINLKTDSKTHCSLHRTLQDHSSVKPCHLQAPAAHISPDPSCFPPVPTQTRLLLSSVSPGSCPTPARIIDGGPAYTVRRIRTAPSWPWHPVSHRLGGLRSGGAVLGSRAVHLGSSSHPGLPSSGILRSGTVWCRSWRGVLSHAPSHVRSRGPGSNLTQVFKQEVGVCPAPDIEFQCEAQLQVPTQLLLT
ncbi:Transposon Tf2-8 polyprotein [Labeo rohita]|uniref:Gypsy retrotransposon integrase-like protein 1 n=1 Tax=Labeo rohita TaxID=84645 RepID=A0ABQ8LME7_LABRO|nr:Transposon Tf2-8 polyprotein [Labeo rohita]